MTVRCHMSYLKTMSTRAPCPSPAKELRGDGLAEALERLVPGQPIQQDTTDHHGFQRHSKTQPHLPLPPSVCIEQHYLHSNGLAHRQLLLGAGGKNMQWLAPQPHCRRQNTCGTEHTVQYHMAWISSSVYHRDRASLQRTNTKAWFTIRRWAQRCVTLHCVERRLMNITSHLRASTLGADAGRRSS